MRSFRDNPEIYKQRMQQVGFVMWVGTWVNFFLAVFKIVAGYLGNSRAVLADGVHSFSDLLTNIVVLVGVRFWLAPPDAAHPYGHQRLESLVSLFIGVVLGFMGISICYDAIMRIGKPQTEQIGSILALVAALASIIIKEVLFRWTLASLRRHGRVRRNLG